MAGLSIQTIPKMEPNPEKAKLTRLKMQEMLGD